MGKRAYRHALTPLLHWAPLCHLALSYLMCTACKVKPRFSVSTLLVSVCGLLCGTFITSDSMDALCCCRSIALCCVEHRLAASPPLRHMCAWPLSPRSCPLQEGLAADPNEHEKADEELAGAEDAVKQVPQGGRGRAVCS